MPGAETPTPTPIEQSLAQARAGATAALGRLIDHFRDYLWRIAEEQLSASLNPKVAPSDVVQETAMQATRDFDRFQGSSEEELRAWLRQILLWNVRDAARRWQRAQKRAATELSLDAPGEQGVPAADVLTSEVPSPSALVRVEEDRLQLLLAMRQLTAEDCRVIELRTFQELPFEQVGAAMQRSPDAARKLWGRAVERLAELLKRSQDDGRVQL